MSLKVIHQGNENLVEDGSTALIGSDASASIRIVRPGISRKHAVVSHDGGAWKVEDAGSRNGTFKDGRRVQTIEISGPTTLYLGHPTDGEAVSLVPVASGAPATAPATAPAEAPADVPVVDEEFALTEPEPSTPPTPAPAAAAATGRSTERTRVQPPAVSSGSTQVSDVELAQLTAAIRDQVSAVKGLTWSVWAMIAVTAALIVLTLFVGILSN